MIKRYKGVWLWVWVFLMVAGCAAIQNIPDVTRSRAQRIEYPTLQPIVIQNLSPTLMPTAKYLEQNPLPTPEYATHFTRITNYSGFVESGYCAVVFGINEVPLGERGYNAEQFDQHLSTSIHISIDNIPVPDGNVDIVNGITFQGVLDEDGRIVGSVGGPLDVCAYVTSLAPGLHLATVQFTTAGGTSYSYTWTFLMDDRTPPPTPLSGLPTPVVLPSFNPSPTAAP
jgi:hypothetical protein